MNKELITDEQALTGATTRFGTPIRTYDDGFGPLWVYRTSLGITGVVRAETWEGAYSCVLDEILTPIPDEDVIEAYGFYVLPQDVFHREESKEWYAMRNAGENLATFDTEQEAIKYCQDTMAREECDLVEGYQYQDNATGSGIVSTDLNGESLGLLTPETTQELEISLQLEDY